MLIKTEKTTNPVFGWTVDDDSDFYPELIEKVKNGASIVHEFSREIDPSEEYIYLFYKSFHPTIIETAFKGKIEYVGIFPEETAPHAYKFTPSDEVILKGLGLVGVNEEGNDWALVEVPKQFKSNTNNNENNI
ncbi:MAG: hypothetical protein R6W68_00745 [Ignavibacteriaceae bacterium]